MPYVSMNLSSSTRRPARVVILAAAVVLSMIAGSPELRAETPLVADKAARELMHHAHNARAVWNDFPGFTAKLTVRTDDALHHGTIRVTPDFQWTLDLPQEAQKPWLKSKLQSVISHRRPDDFTDSEFGFVPGPHTAEAGRLIAQLDGSGVFRIKDGVIAEVLRKGEKQWLEITNVEMLKTAEGHELPRVSSVVFRDPSTGDITSNLTNTFEWKRLGRFDLPRRTFTVDVAAKGNRSVRELTFDDVQLLAPQAVSAK